jgi:two-component system NtrC family sensor kinase
MMHLTNRASLLALALGWCAATTIVVALLVDARRSALERGERAASAIVQVMEQHTARTFQTAALTARAVADAWTLARPRTNDPRFQALLQQRLSDLPHARALFVIGPDGRLIHDTDYPRTPDASLADRAYFTAFRDNPRLEHDVSGPYLSRSGDAAGWFVSVVARLGAPGEFHGVVVAALPVSYFETLYAKMVLGEGEVIALFHRDGTLVARHPASAEDIGRSFKHLPLFSAAARNASGSFRVEGQLVPGKRIVAYRTVEGLPFVVHVSPTERVLLAEWRRSAAVAGVAMAALTLVLAVVLVQRMRQRNRIERLRAQRAQAEKLEALGQLTGGIAHDFANLLHVVSASLQVLALRPDERDQVLQAASVARRAVERGTDLIARLLAFARRQPLELRPADLNSLVTAAHPLVAQAAGARIELVLRLAPGLPVVLTDESQLEIALLNLVVNARDAMSGKGRISLRTHAAGSGEVCLTVEDDGLGMSEKVRLRALEPFFTTKGDAGTGLGLSQVYGFMRQAGGSVELDSSPGTGTRVHLRFAAASPGAPADHPSRPETPEQVV